ncbi:MAG: hypothetical protein RLY97_216 [Pseudomonadota bacterium]
MMAVGNHLRKFAKLYILGAIAAAVLGLLAYKIRTSIYIFDGVSGPSGRDVVVTRKPAQIADFGRGSAGRMAVLVTDADSNWLGLARGLRAHGIPFVMTRDVAEAVKHRVIYAYPMISGRVIKPEGFVALRAHVEGGGALLAYDIQGGGLQDLFGVKVEPKTSHAEYLSFAEDVLVSLPGQHEQIGHLGDSVRFSRSGTEAAFPGAAYQVTDGTVAARFADGGAALVCGHAAGQACALGLDLGRLTGRVINGRMEAAGRTYVNGYEPSLDRLYQWLAAFYVKNEPMPWLMDTAPAGYQFSIVLTHDVDFTSAMGSAQNYAKRMHEAGVKGTFFIQTKYIKDYNDDVFFNAKTLPNVKQVLAYGMEVGSHTVAHARAIKFAAMGSGRESYPSYLPYTTSSQSALNMTILGELRVSKFLLTRVAGAKVTAYRSGYLANPFVLPQALAATGFAYDSTITANSCLTHLPYQLTSDRQDSALEPVYEFPVTIEDEDGKPMNERFDDANMVIEEIAQDRGFVVIQVHPDDRSKKLDFEVEAIRRYKGRAWFATLSEFGDWWRARDLAEIDVQRGVDGGWQLAVKSNYMLDNLQIKLPKAHLATGAAGAIHTAGQVATLRKLQGAAVTSWR